MRPRALGKIAIIVLMIICILTAVIFALKHPDKDDLYLSLRGITYSVLALTFATLYRYLED